MTVGVLVGCLCWFTFADFVGGCVVMFCCLLVLGWYLFALMGCIDCLILGCGLLIWCWCFSCVYCFNVYLTGLLCFGYAVGSSGWCVLNTGLVVCFTDFVHG